MASLNTPQGADRGGLDGQSASPNPSHSQVAKPSPTNEIGFPQYERTLDHFYMWTSGGSLRDKLAEFAVRYETSRADNEHMIIRDQMYDAIIGFFSSDTWLSQRNGTQPEHPSDYQKNATEVPHDNTK